MNLWRSWKREDPKTEGVGERSELIIPRVVFVSLLLNEVLVGHE
jgi:hypothetical protein